MRTLTFLAFATVLAACAGPAEEAADDAPTVVTAAVADMHQAVSLTPQQEAGRVVFESVCWTCHGLGGHGDGPAETAEVAPPTFHTRDYTMASPELLMQRFRASLQGDDPSHPHMTYVAKLVVEQSFADAVAYIPALTYPPEIPGSATNGKHIFEYRCAGCHGVSGKGDGPGAAALVEVRPADFTADTLVAARDWDAVFTKVKAGGDRVHGSTMPSWSMILSDADMWDLVAYLATFQPGVVAPPNWGN